MATIAQPSLFSWKSVEASPEIVRLGRLLDALPAERLLATLESERKGRRNEYPLRAMFRATVALAVLGHRSVASLRRELKRNAELREVCGFDPLEGERAVPSDCVFSRFYKRLEAHSELVSEMFERLVECLAKVLPDLGRHLAADSKALLAIGARPADAETGTKSYESLAEDGTVRRTVMTWWGWKLHLVCDAKYELPLAFEVTRASAADSPRLIPLVEHLREEHPGILERTETLAADKAYDDGKDKADLYDKHAIVALIPPRDTTSTRSAPAGMEPLDPSRNDTIYLSATGQVMCRTHPFRAKPQEQFTAMQFCGYERDRDTLKFRCPARAFGIECRNRQTCQCRPTVREGKHGRVVRVARRRDTRTLMPMHYHSRTFEQAYRRRTSVERLFSRLDNTYGFQTAIVKSRQRMETRVSLALIAMLSTALAYIEAHQPQHMRRLFGAA